MLPKLYQLVVLISVLALSGQTVVAQEAVLSLPAADRQMINSRLGSEVVGEPLPSKSIDDVSMYFPLSNATANYQVISGPNAGKIQSLEVNEARRPNGKPAWRFQLSPSLTTFIRPTLGGDLLAPSVSDEGEGVVVITSPATPFLLKGIQPGESRSYQQRVMVYALEDPADREYSGTLTSSYTYLGAYNVTVPAGTYKTVLFRLKCSGKVGPAMTYDTAYYFFAPHRGVVAMISQEDATAFWIIHIDTSSGKVLRN